MLATLGRVHAPAACISRKFTGRRAAATGASISSGTEQLPHQVGEPSLIPSPLSGFKVLVAGATGGVGKQVVQVLVDAGVPCRALVRDLQKARDTLPVSSGLVELVQADVFQYASLPSALGDADSIICATGASGITDPLGPFNIDFQGTANLVALAQQRGCRKFVLVSSIGADELLNPLNLFWGVLFWKKRGEEVLQRSGLDYTIVRPGGLKNTLKQGEVAGNIVAKPAGFYGVPPASRNPAGSILRRQVAELSVAALYEPGAVNKVVECIATRDAPALTMAELFNSV